MLLHLIDGTCEHAGEAYKIVRGELDAYGHGLADKPEIVALNKSDALTPEAAQAADRAPEARRQENAAGDFRRDAAGRAGSAARADEGHRHGARAKTPTSDDDARLLAAKTRVMTKKLPAIADFRRIVVKIGSSLLVDARSRPRQGSVARIARRRRREAARGRARSTDRVVRRDRARPIDPEIAKGSAQARRQPGRSGRRTDRTGAHVVGSAAPPRHRRRANSRHARRHRRASALSQRALDHHAPARMARGAGDQRKRHGCHERNPLRRQRSPGGARRHHGQRRPCWCCFPISTVFTMRRPAQASTANLIPVVERITPQIESMAGAAGIGTVARRHADQDRGRQDRDHRRHAYGDRVGPDRTSAAGDRRWRTAARGFSRRQIR